MADTNIITLSDFNVICRFCLKKDEQLKPIIKSEDNGGGNAAGGGASADDDYFDATNKATTPTGDPSIVDMISSCTGLEVSVHNRVAAAPFHTLLTNALVSITPAAPHRQPQLMVCHCSSAILAYIN